MTDSCLIIYVALWASALKQTWSWKRFEKPCCGKCKRNFNRVRFMCWKTYELINQEIDQVRRRLNSFFFCSKRKRKIKNRKTISDHWNNEPTDYQQPTIAVIIIWKFSLHMCTGMLKTKQIRMNNDCWCRSVCELCGREETRRSFDKWFIFSRDLVDK